MWCKKIICHKYPVLDNTSRQKCRNYVDEKITSETRISNLVLGIRFHRIKTIEVQKIEFMEVH